MTKNDSFNAKLAFYLSLGFWIPLFNIAFSVVAIIFGVKAVKDYFKNPNQYKGLKYAVIALIISITSIVLTVIGTIFYFFSQNICSSALCQSALNAG